jgi:hypothetical protein
MFYPLAMNKKPKQQQSKIVNREIQLVELDIKCLDCSGTFHWSGYSGKYPKRCPDCMTIRKREQRKNWHVEQKKKIEALKEELTKVKEEVKKQSKK